ncbi:hypothetical protein LTS10_011809 [Elasticomyces elasticus]|nr:hypothetical protein LTS10_011809 [Elasticomyces elasticus]
MAGTIATSAVVAAAWVHSAFRGPAYSPTHHANITAELSPLLSANASILGPGSTGWSEAALRWQPWKRPVLDIIVEVVTEQDIEHSIRVANHHRRPFLAISGGHGGTRDLSNVRNGVGIRMRGMKYVTIAEDGRTARIGGGILSGELAHTLWAEGKQNVGGGCECTGAVAPMLGGGHGWLQGQYGLMADNLISARLTLANATTVTVSATLQPGLFWALQGAGHNFGIMSSFEYKLHDRTPENEKWTYDLMVFRQDQLEDVYRTAEELDASTHTVELAHWSYWLRNPVVDPVNPIIMFYVIYQGTTIPSQHSKPFHNLKPVSSQVNTTDLLGLAKVTLLDMTSPFCAHSNTTAVQRWPTLLKTYPISGLRSAFNKLASLPSPFNGSAFIIEAYSLQAVQAVPEDSTAFADRRSSLLLSPFLIYPISTQEVDEQGEQHGREMQQILANASGSPLSAYINYASGFESQEALFGYQPWRLEKLRALKREYDPEGRFSYYAAVDT